MTCAALIEQWNMTFLEAAEFLYSAGIYFLERNQDTQATAFLQRAETIREQCGEPPFPDVTIVLKAYKLLLTPSHILIS